jgi:hypothetical protein
VDALVSSVLLSILAQGLLRIRAAANMGDVKQCFIEADHLHNLPELIEHYSDELLNYYLGVTRAAFVGETTLPTDDLQPLWDRLIEYAARRNTAH